MSNIRNSTLMSAVTIPGTHDSAAYTRAWPFVQTQTMAIESQLRAGIRYFDLRCGILHDVPVMVHGVSYLGLTLQTVLDTMYDFLEKNETEALIVQIKQDRAADPKSTVHFSQAVSTCISQDSARWRTANDTPRLGELRGKIQLFRRFHGPSLSNYGIDMTQWQDNPSRPFTINTRNDIRITIQDHYSFPDPVSLPDMITRKGGDVSELLVRASEDWDPAHWYINFTSAYEFNLYYQLSPREVAVGGYWAFQWKEGMNPRLNTWLLGHKDENGRYARFGIVAMDFPELGAEDLIMSLVKTNRVGNTGMWAFIAFVLVLPTFACLLLWDVVLNEARMARFLGLRLLNCRH